MAEKPSVTIHFRQLASTLIERGGERPVVILAKEAEEGGVFEKLDLLNGAVTAEDMSKYSADNNDDLAKSVNLAIAASPNSIYITTMKSGELLKTLYREELTNAITAAGCEGSCEKDLKTAYKTFNNTYGVFVMCVGNDKTTHDTRYICANTEDVKYYNDDEELSEYNVLCMYAGAIAACGCERSLTNYTLPCTRAEYTAEFGSEPDLAKAGQLGAEMKGGKVRVIAGVNTAEVSGDVTEDMQYIEVINTMDVIAGDIARTFINYYRGAYKNDYDNQLLFIAAINEYFRQLANEDILDPDYSNTAGIDAAEQRAAWVAQGHAEAADWDEQTVKERSFKRMVFLQADIKVCQSMESLTMYITLQ